MGRGATSLGEECADSSFFFLLRDQMAIGLDTGERVKEGEGDYSESVLETIELRGVSTRVGGLEARQRVDYLPC